ncbi:hypothetical protein EVAR_57068_1 [Eumeta japonica]|uniref:Protein zwilch n=1 Tax=Eumeta variegata TaxID=151549 RepID=A0A4C1Y862_EUMVA|nr:hypothetical protein EVAR_57068_1 [Eumeta japonica]
MKLLSPILEAFPKYDINIQSPPSYVKFYTKDDKEIILVFVKSKQTVLNGKENKATVNATDITEEFELTGSPLKLDLSLHAILDDTMIYDEPQLWIKEENNHSPISVNNARSIGNLYNELLRELDKDEMVPMWIVCDPTEENRPLLLTAQSYKDYFARGIVTYDGYINYEDIDVDKLIQKFATRERIEETDEQEIIVGHLQSPSNNIWKSVCALYSINQLLVDMTAAGYAAYDLSNVPIRRNMLTNTPYPDNTKRLTELLNEVETYTYTAQCQKGGFICYTEETVSLKQCLDAMEVNGSSNDFTYRLWDILKDSESAEEVITLLLQALKVISSGKMKPFIDASNKTYLAKLVLKLSRGHSQTGKVLKNLRSNPPQTLSLIGQVAVEKTMWEYTQLMSLIEHSFYITGIWANEARSHESIEQINQTIHDMTMGGGDFTLNPFESKLNENSIRFDSESFYEDDPNELSVNEFVSLKKHGLVPHDKKVTNEVPLIADEIDISNWKNLLTKFAQVHLCLEHLIRAQSCLGTDFVSLKPLASRFREFYVSDKSPIKTVGQLMNEPIQNISIPITNSLIKDELNGRTCGPDALDNLGSRECDRYREHLRQLIMPSRTRPMPTWANAGRPACVSAAEHARRAPDRPASIRRATRHRGCHGRAKQTGAAALCAQRTLNVADAARLPRCRRRGACPDVVGTISLNCERTLRDAPRRLD